MGVTFVILYELDEGQNHQQAVQLIHSRLDSCGATREGNFQYESEVHVFYLLALILNRKLVLSNE